MLGEDGRMVISGRLPGFVPPTPASPDPEVAGPSGTSSSGQVEERRVVPWTATSADVTHSRAEERMESGEESDVEVLEVIDADPDIAVVYEALTLPVIHRTVPSTGVFVTESNPLGCQRSSHPPPLVVDEGDRALLEVFGKVEAELGGPSTSEVPQVPAPTAPLNRPPRPGPDLRSSLPATDSTIRGDYFVIYARGVQMTVSLNNQQAVSSVIQMLQSYVDDIVSIFFVCLMFLSDFIDPFFFLIVGCSCR